MSFIIQIEKIVVLCCVFGKTDTQGLGLNELNHMIMARVAESQRSYVIFASQLLTEMKTEHREEV